MKYQRQMNFKLLFYTWAHCTRKYILGRSKGGGGSDLMTTLKFYTIVISSLTNKPLRLVRLLSSIKVINFLFNSLKAPVTTFS